jgi:hypothetical protein
MDKRRLEGIDGIWNENENIVFDDELMESAFAGWHMSHRV